MSLRWIVSLEESFADVKGPDAWIVRAGGEDARRAVLQASIEPDDRLHAARRRGSQRTAAALERRRLLRAFAARRLGVEPATLTFVQDPDGPPEIIAPKRLCLSSGARDGWMLLAASATPIGADVERSVQGDARPIALFHPSMADRLARASDDEFTATWSGVEAYLKFLGVGLSALADVVVEGDAAFWPGSIRPPARLVRRWIGAFVFTIALR